MVHPKVSIIVPIYNGQSFLGNCIDSILNQSYNDYELLLVDDGSTDSSGNICDMYAKRDRRVKVFHKKNEGVSKARNLGLQNAKGEFIFFCDADDSIRKNGLSILINLMKDNVDIGVGGYEVCNSNGQIDQPKIREVRKSETLSFAKSLFNGDYGFYQGYLWNKIFRREIINNNNLIFQENIYYNEDRLFILSYLSCAEGYCVYNSDLVYSYYKNNNGAMGSVKSLKQYEKFETDLDAYLKMYEIGSIWNDKTLLRLIEQGAINSWLKNKYLINLYSNNKKKDKKRVNKKISLISSKISLIRIVIFMWSREIKRNILSLLQFK